MKKLTAAILTASAASLMLVGCANKKGPEFTEACEHAPGIQAPEWVCDPSIEGGVAGVGSARPNPANDMNMQRSQAMAKARTDIARTLETKVQAMLTDWSRTTGAGDNQTYESNFEDVSRQLAQQTLNNTRQLKRWVAPNDRTLYLLVGMDPAQTKDALKENIKTSMGNKEALWQQFQSKQALDSLDSQLDKAFQ